MSQASRVKIADRLTASKTTEQDVKEVLSRLRADDLREITSMVGNPHSREFASACVNSPICVTFFFDDKPFAVLGATEMWKGVWNAFMFGTDEMRKAGPRLTKHLAGMMQQTMIEADAHRLCCYSAVWYKKAHKWLKHLGFKREATLSKWAADKSNFAVFSIVR